MKNDKGRESGGGCVCVCVLTVSNANVHGTHLINSCWDRLVITVFGCTPLSSQKGRKFQRVKQLRVFIQRGSVMAHLTWDEFERHYDDSPPVG